MPKPAPAPVNISQSFSQQLPADFAKAFSQLQVQAVCPQCQGQFFPIDSQGRVLPYCGGFTCNSAGGQYNSTSNPLPNTHVKDATSNRGATNPNVNSSSNATQFGQNISGGAANTSYTQNSAGNLNSATANPGGYSNPNVPNPGAPNPGGNPNGGRAPGGNPGGGGGAVSG